MHFGQCLKLFEPKKVPCPETKVLVKHEKPTNIYGYRIRETQTDNPARNMFGYYGAAVPWKN
jgi:hypothetical protein